MCVKLLRSIFTASSPLLCPAFAYNYADGELAYILILLLNTVGYSITQEYA